MYVPLYITNSCTNHCVYCGFQHDNPIARVILKDDEIVAECEAIRELGPFENLLIVTGENPRDAGVDYIENALRLARPYFSNLSIEVMPLSTGDYARLTRSGLNGVVCFQETYNRARYNVYHPRGMKSKFDWRVDGFDRMGQAGVHKIGMGVLIGLEEWRTDVTMMALHLKYLRKHYWQTRYSVNFPRMRPSEGHFQPNVVMSDRELAQLIFAYRIFDHDVDISVSTRESAAFRNKYGYAGHHLDERRIENRSGRLPHPPAGAGAVQRQRRAVTPRGGTGYSRHRLRNGMEGLGPDLRLTERYARQIMLPEVGEEGQRRLDEASVLVVGVGGLGSAVSLYLTAAGIGRIGLVDDDRVSLSNLQRQVLYTEAEVGECKALCARRRLQALSPHTRIDAWAERLTPENAGRLVAPTIWWWTAATTSRPAI